MACCWGLGAAAERSPQHSGLDLGLEPTAACWLCGALALGHLACVPAGAGSMVPPRARPRLLLLLARLLLLGRLLLLLVLLPRWVGGWGGGDLVSRRRRPSRLLAQSLPPLTSEPSPCAWSSCAPWTWPCASGGRYAWSPESYACARGSKGGRTMGARLSKQMGVFEHRHALCQCSPGCRSAAGRVPCACW